MITEAAYYKGRDVTHAAELTDAIRAAAAAFLPKFNGCISEFEAATGVSLTQCNSGWRPAAVNRATPGASATSKHLTGHAGDAADQHETFESWLDTEDGAASLERWDLYREHPDSTPGWVHLQDEPFGSYRPGGTRTFRVK